MSSASDRLRDRARRTRDAAQARTAAGTPPAAAEQLVPPTPSVAPIADRAEPPRTVATPVQKVRTAPVRITVDLSPVDHRNLKQWCDNTAEQLGRASIASAEVVRLLLDQLHADPALAQAVTAGLAQRAR